MRSERGKSLALVNFWTALQLERCVPDSILPLIMGARSLAQSVFVWGARVRKRKAAADHVNDEQ
jgi:hypothetical protein